MQYAFNVVLFMCYSIAFPKFFFYTTACSVLIGAFWVSFLLCFVNGIYKSALKLWNSDLFCSWILFSKSTSIKQA